MKFQSSRSFPPSFTFFLSSVKWFHSHNQPNIISVCWEKKNDFRFRCRLSSFLPFFLVKFFYWHLKEVSGGQRNRPNEWINQQKKKKVDEKDVRRENCGRAKKSDAWKSIVWPLIFASSHHHRRRRGCRCRRSSVIIAKLTHVLASIFFRASFSIVEVFTRPKWLKSVPFDTHTHLHAHKIIYEFSFRRKVNACMCRHTKFNFICTHFPSLDLVVYHPNVSN